MSTLIRRTAAEQEEIGVAARRHGAARRYHAVIARRAGRAIHHREEVEEELTTAIEQLGGAIDNEEIRRLGGRVTRLAGALVAADAEPAAAERRNEAFAALRRARGKQ